MRWMLLVAALLVIADRGGRAQRPPAQPFSIIEASIADMRTAMELGRTTSREIVQQYLTPP